jgi:hypothetical protein
MSSSQTHLYLAPSQNASAFPFRFRKSRLYWFCLAKQSRALLASNPARDNQTKAGE